MTPLLSLAEMRALEQAAAADGAEHAQLIHAAGHAVADFLSAHYPDGPVLALCGPGHNGDDGLVAAGALRRQGRRVDVWRWQANAKTKPALIKGGIDDAKALTADAAAALGSSLADARRYGVVLDALFGAGLNRPLPPWLAPLADASRRAEPPFVAVDVPSGLHGDKARPLGELVFAAQASLAFAAPRPAHYVLPGRALCGRVHVADIGIRARRLREIAPAVRLNAPSHWSDALPRARLESHKYHRGTVLLVAGPAFATGAAELAALAALRLGAGLVTLAAAPAALRTLHLAAEILRAPMGWRQAQGFARLPRLIGGKEAQVLVLGPNLAGATCGRQAGGMARVRRLVRTALRQSAQLVLDADALSAHHNRRADFARALRAHAERSGKPPIVTPHAGEFARLFPGWLEDKGRLGAARAAAKEMQSICVLKGADTIIAAPSGRALVNHTAPPFLAVAGAGDVLAGMIAALCAQAMPPWNAAAAAVWLHGEAAQRLGAGLMAGELAQAAAQILAERQKT